LNGVHGVKVVDKPVLAATLRSDDPRLRQLPEARLDIDQCLNHDRVLHELLVEGLINHAHAPIAICVLRIIHEANLRHLERPFKTVREVRQQLRHILLPWQNDGATGGGRGQDVRRTDDEGIVCAHRSTVAIQGQLCNFATAGEQRRSRLRQTPMALFTSTIRSEGGKHAPLLLIPAALRMPAGWLRTTINDSAPCFVYARGFGPRAALPVWRFPDLKVGDKVHVEVEPAESYRATKAHVTLFDWNAFVGGDDRTFATDEPNGVLRLWSRYSAPFEVIRHPPNEALYWLSGFYQAEGSKSSTGRDFSFANTNVALIHNAIEQLRELGIGANQLYAEVLQGIGESRESAMAKYESLGLEVTAVRPRSGRGESTYVLHAHNSKPFRGMVNAALAWIFANEFPNRELAKAFAFGWLDGDGTITLSGGNARLRLAGHHEEQATVLRALCHAFDWRDRTIHFGPLNQHTEWTLNSTEAINLALADVFPFSMSRARLLHRIDQTEPLKIARIHRDCFLAGSAALKLEIEALRQLKLTDTHPKGAPYPLQKRNGRWVLPAADFSVTPGFEKP
jgi:hypothetical protein